MSQAPRQSRGLHPIRAAASVHGRLDAHAPRPGRAEIRRDHTGLDAHWFVVAFSLAQLAYQPCGLAGALCRVCAAVPAAGGVQWIHALPAGEQDHHMALVRGCGFVTMVSVATAIAVRCQPLFRIRRTTPLAGYALVFTSWNQAAMVCSPWLSAMYLAISLTVGNGIDMGATLPCLTRTSSVCGGGNGQPGASAELGAALGGIGSSNVTDGLPGHSPAGPPS